MGDTLELFDVVEDQIKTNNLEGLPYDFLVKQLSVLNNKDFSLVKDVIDHKVGSGRLKISDGKIYFCSKDEKLKHINEKIKIQQLNRNVIIKKNQKTKNDHNNSKFEKTDNNDNLIYEKQANQNASFGKTGNNNSKFERMTDNNNNNNNNNNDNLSFEKQANQNASFGKTGNNNSKFERMTDNNNSSFGGVDKGKSNFSKKSGVKSGLFGGESNREENIDLAYKILERKDGKSKNNNKLIEGKLQGTSKGYAFLIPNDVTIDDVFIPQNELNGAMHNDKVVVTVSLGKSGRKEGRVSKIIERGNNNIVGKIVIGRKGGVVTPNDVKFGKDLIIPLNKTLNAKTGEIVVCSIEKYFIGDKSPEGRVTEVLGTAGEIDVEVLGIIRESELYESFPNVVSEFAKKLPIEIDKNNFMDRWDFTDKLIFTIDGEDTRDIDDAISLEINAKGNRVLGVHIADVGQYVKVGNPIDKEAFIRGTSVYFPNLVLPMLPRELSNGICSLNERVDRLAISVLMEVDSLGKLISYKIGESIINSKKRFTYTEVYKVLCMEKDALDKYSQFADTLLKMNELSKQLATLRKNRGEIMFNIPEVSVILDDLGNVINLSKRESNDSHKMIESFMIMANETIAHNYLLNKIPFVYRIHEEPDAEKIMKFLNILDSSGIKYKMGKDKITSGDIQKALNETIGNDNEYAINKICLRSMKKAKYSPQCLGHFGLASVEYCHFTSPIRRYPDLTIHRIIKECIHNKMNGKNMAFYKNFVVESSSRSSEREKVADTCERDVDDLYRAFYMKNHIAEEFEGIVSGVTAFGIFVELDNTVEGLISMENLPYDHYSYNEDKFELVGAHNTYRLGQKLKIKVLNVDISQREIDFMIV